MHFVDFVLAVVDGLIVFRVGLQRVVCVRTASKLVLNINGVLTRKSVLRSRHQNGPMILIDVVIVDQHPRALVHCEVHNGEQNELAIA